MVSQRDGTLEKQTGLKELFSTVGFVRAKSKTSGANLTTGLRKVVQVNSGATPVNTNHHPSQEAKYLRVISCVGADAGKLWLKNSCGRGTNVEL